MQLIKIVALILVATAFESLAYLLMPSLFDILNSNTTVSSNILIDNLVLFGFKSTLISLTVLLFCLFLLKGIFVFLSGRFTVDYLQAYMHNLRCKLSRKVRDVDYIEFSRMDTKVVTSYLVDQTQKSGDYIKFNIQMLVQLSFLITYLLLLIYISLPISLIFAFISLIIFFFFKSLRNTTIHQSSEYASSITQHYLNVDSALSSYVYLTVKNGWDVIFKKILLSSLNLKKSGSKIGLQSSLQNSVKEPLILLLVIFVLILNHMFFKLKFSSFIVLIVLLQRSFNALVGVQLQLQLMGEWVGSHKQVLAFEKELDKYKRVKVISSSSVLPITFKNVSFKYDEHYVFKKLNFTVNKFDIIGIHGSSGSGKSTLFKLIAGLIRPADGYVYYGIEKTLYSDLSEESVGFYSQASRFYPGTILENLTLFNHNVHELHVREVLKRFKILTIIDSLEYGINTNFVGDSMFSSGQYQRLLLAREVLTRPGILFLDEPTSALDNEAVSYFNLVIDELKGKSTIFIISHQMDTLNRCERIFKVENSGLIAV